MTIAAAAVAWLGGLITAGLLWGQVRQAPDAFTSFSVILASSIRNWSSIVIGMFLIAIILMAFFSVKKPLTLGRLGAVVSAVILVPFVSYLALCGQMRIFGALLASTGLIDCLTHESARLEWLVFALGPSMSMLAIALSLVVFIGLLGRTAPDWTREWWTRYGAWIAMMGAVSLLAAGAAVFAPWAILRIAHLEWKTISGAVAWVGSVISGLLAGKSTKTGEGGERSKTLEIVARVGGFLFIAGAVSVGSTIVHLILREALGDDAHSYTQNLQTIVEKQIGGTSIPWMLVLPVLTAALAWLFSNRFDLNTFGLNQFYRNRLVRCYLGVTRWQPGKRKAHPFTGFDRNDDILLSDLQTVGLGHPPDASNHFCGERFRGPFPIINCTLGISAAVQTFQFIHGKALHLF